MEFNLTLKILQFECCGVKNYKDYTHQADLPKSCCNLERISKLDCNTKNSDLYKDGCMHHLDDALDFVYKVLGWVCGAIGLVLVSKFSSIDPQNMTRFFTLIISFIL